jgi:hypothetical protein
MGSAQLSSKGKTGQSGHFYFAEKRTFLFGVDTKKLGAFSQSIDPKSAIEIVAACPQIIF